MKNDFLDYYGEHHISPVRQNIDDISLHYERRRKLYRQCGMPYKIFQNSKILEIGPGSGFNSLYFLQPAFGGGGAHLDLVEANLRGIEDIKKLFKERDIDEKAYTIYNSTIENFCVDKKYDIIICEGFIMYLSNQDEIIRKLKSLAADRGIIVVTCADNVCMFTEAMKRLFACIMTRDIKDYGAKVQYLTTIFAPQLKTLRGVSRPAEDWVKDQLLNPAGVNGNELSLAQAIEKFGDDYFVLGSSPAMFTDYSWYKDVWVNTSESYVDQFAQKRLSLLDAGMPEFILSREKSDELVSYFEKVKDLANTYESCYDDEILYEIEENLSEIERKSDVLPLKFRRILRDIMDIIKRMRQNKSCDLDFEKYGAFFCAFGRTLQYIAFEKR